MANGPVRRRSWRSSVAALVFAVAGIVALDAAGAPPAAAFDLVVAQGSEPITFDPTQFASGNHVFLHQLYDALVDLGPDGRPTPSLAESWERSPDGLTVRFVLRPATFHSGRPVTADDVVFTIERYLDESVGANLMERMESFAGVRAVDDRTVELTLSAPTPGLFDLLSAVFIQDRDAIGDIARRDAGSGRYTLSDFQPGVSFTMSRFGDHWDDSQTGPDDVVVRIIPDEGTAAAALQTGDVDVLLQASALTAEGLEGIDGLKVLRPDTAPVTYYLMANTTRGPLANTLFRRAIERAIDRQTIADVVYAGAAVPTCQPWSASHWAHDASLETACAFDLAAAQALMTESGVGPVTLTVNTAVDSYSAGSAATAQILKEALAEIGVTLDIVTYEQARARELLLASDFDLLLHSYTEGGNDPQFIMPSGLYGPNGRAKFTSPEYEALVASANGTLDLDARKKIYSDISKLIIDNAFIMPIVHGLRVYPMKDKVEGFALDVSGFPVLSGVSMAE
jgi:peptide/nickel transport system substrate-binding protein